MERDLLPTYESSKFIISSLRTGRSYVMFCISYCDITPRKIKALNSVASSAFLPVFSRGVVVYY